MNQADRAVENAITLECKKDGLSQRQSGDWTLRLTVAAVDMNHRITNAPMGTRYQCVLVEVSDDETPVDHVAKERDKWRDLGCTKQAGIRCKEPLFWAFLREQGFPLGATFSCEDEEDAADIVREICGVESRSEFNKPGNAEARIAWHKLDNAYQAWRIAEHG